MYVVTVNYHSEDAIAKLVTSLEQVQITELIVVDHSESENLKTLHANFPIKIITQKNRGYGAGLNRGVAEIPDPEALVLMCNPDILLLDPKSWPDLDTFLLDNPKIGLIIPKLLDSDLQPIPSCREFYSWSSIVLARLKKYLPSINQRMHKHYYLDLLSTDKPDRVDWGSGAAILTKARYFKTYFCFDERFFLYFEDVDLSAQVWRSGYEVLFHPGVVCIHQESRMSHIRWRYLYFHVKSLMQFTLKYCGLPTRDALRTTDHNP